MTNSFCQELIAQFSGFVVRAMDCSEEAGYDVIVTPFLYPDRDNIEVFVQELPDERVLLTDLGQTMMKLSSYGFVPTQSPRRRAMIHQITSSMNVSYEGGNIVVTASRFETGPRLWDMVMSLQRLSDLVFTVPGFTKATFSDEFEDFALETGVPYERGVPIRLPSHSFIADYVFRPMGQPENVVQLISAGSLGYARERVSSVYLNFSEMIIAGDKRQRIAVIDDRAPVVDSQMQETLRHMASSVHLWTRRGELAKLLRAA